MYKRKVKIATEVEKNKNELLNRIEEVESSSMQSLRLVALLTLLSLLVLASCSSALAVRYPNSPGETSPERVEIAVGGSADIYCSMNPSVFPGQNASNLEFIDTNIDQAVPRQHIAILNATTIVYHLRNAAEQQTTYRCKCGVDHAIMETRVFVGAPPHAITDFGCRSYDFLYMVCNFTRPANPVLTQYNLTFYTDNWMYKNNIACNYDDQRLVVCNTTQYVSKTSQYHFVLNVSNALGKLEQHFDISKFNVMVLARPGEDLHVMAGYPTTDAINITWRLAKGDFYRARELQWQILLQPENCPVQNLTATVRIARVRKEMQLYLTNLPYAYYNYTLRVRVKVRNATYSELMWSEPLVYRFRTAARRPARPPATDVSSFYVDSTETLLRLYWEELPVHEHNGANFTYTISEVRCNNKTIKQSPLELKSNSAIFAWRNNGVYEFEVRSSNHMGESLAASRIVVYPHAEKQYKPRSIHNLYHDQNLTYTLTWEAPRITRGLRDYTVFWCHSNRSLLNECNSSVHFAHVDAHVQSFTTAPQAPTLKLAVAANYDNYTTGMHWPYCTLDVDSDLEKMEPETQAIEATALKIQWSLENVCPSILDGYNLTYCEVRAQFVDGVGGWPCVEAPISLSVDRNLRKMRLEQLKPYTMYKVEMFMYSSSKMGKVSDALRVRTLETAPSPPRHLNVSRVTNTSAWCTWLPPSQPNGIIREYLLNVNSRQYVVAAPGTDASEHIVFHLQNLTSYTVYKVYVRARTIANSQPSNDTHFTTLIGHPSQPHNITSYRTVNATVLMWSKPTEPAGRVELYEVAATHFRNAEVVRRRISYIVGGTTCEIKIPLCMDRNDSTVLEVRAVNAALLTQEVNDDDNDDDVNHFRSVGRYTDLDYYSDDDELLCSDPKRSAKEVNRLVAPYRNGSLYRLYRSNWQKMTISYCGDNTFNIIKVMFVVVLALTFMVPLLVARKKYTKMANIRCILPPGLDVYNTKDGPPADDYRHDNYETSDVRRDVVACGRNTRTRTRSNEFLRQTEKRHLLTTLGVTNDSAFLVDAHGGESFGDRTSMDCSSVGTQQTQLSGGTATTPTATAMAAPAGSGDYLHSRQSVSSCDETDSLSDHSLVENSMESVEMDKVSLLPSSAQGAYMDPRLLQGAGPATSCYVNPQNFGNWPRLTGTTPNTLPPAAVPIATTNCSGYVSASDLEASMTQPAAQEMPPSNAYVHAADLHKRFNMAAMPPPKEPTITGDIALVGAGYTALDALQRTTITPAAPVQSGTVATDAAPPHTDAAAYTSNYIKPANMEAKGAISGYVTPRELNALAGADQVAAVARQY